jgi:hypothetical protein
LVYKWTAGGRSSCRGVAFFAWLFRKVEKQDIASILTTDGLQLRTEEKYTSAQSQEHIVYFYTLVSRQ